MEGAPSESSEEPSAQPRGLGSAIRPLFMESGRAHCDQVAGDATQHILLAGTSCEVPNGTGEDGVTAVNGSRNSGTGPMSGEGVQLTVDKVLDRYVGSFGRGQVQHFLLTSLAWVLEALHTLVPIFAEKSPSWKYSFTLTHGSVESFSRNFNSDHSNHTLPSWSHSTMTILHVLNRNNANSITDPPCSLSSSEWYWINRSESTVSQWGLVCEGSYLRGFAQSAYFIGGIFGAWMFGHLSDSKLGRRGALLVSSCTIAAFGMLTAASPNYVVYVALRALTGAASSGLGVVAYVLGIELIGPSCRGTVSLSSFYFYPVGTLLLAGVAFLCTATMSLHYSWRFLYLFTSLPSLVYCFLIVVFIHESPRWYLVHDYNQKAMQVLRSIGNQNGREIPRDIVLVTDERELDEAGDSENAPQTTGTLVDVFRRRDTRFRLIVVVIVWFACALGYYTFNLNVGNLGTNLTLSVVLNGLSEIPGYAVATFLSHRVGRRISLAVTLILGGIASLIGAVLSLHVDNFISAHFHALQIFGAADDNPSATLFLPSSSHMPSVNQAEKHISASVGQNRLESANAGSYIYLVCSMVGLFGMSGAYNILFLYGSELFPTVVRNAALAFANQGGTLGSIVAPFVVTSAHQNTAIPFLVIAFTSLLAGISALKLPETMNRPLHETFDHV